MDMIQARNVAVTHLIVEIVAVFFCYTQLCGIMLFLAVLSSSIVACCCKQRSAFKFWSWIGGLLFVLHLSAAVGAFGGSYYSVSGFPFLVFVLQMFLCGVNVLVVYLGCVITADLREREAIDPVEMRIEMPVRASMYPVAGVQQDAQVSRMLP